MRMPFIIPPPLHPHTHPFALHQEFLDLINWLFNAPEEENLQFSSPAGLGEIGSEDLEEKGCRRQIFP